MGDLARSSDVDVALRASYDAEDLKKLAEEAKKAKTDSIKKVLISGALMLLNNDSKQPLEDNDKLKATLESARGLVSKATGTTPKALDLEALGDIDLDNVSEDEVATFQEILEDAAYDMIISGERKLELHSEPLGAEILATVNRELAYDQATLAVTLRADGLAKLLYNPFFTLSLGSAGTAFVLAHEAYHLLLMHLCVDKHLLGDKNFRAACEIVINDLVMRHMNNRNLPQIAGDDTGVNPRKEHQAYKRAVKDVVQHPATYDQFVESDVRCKAYLDQMPKERDPKGGDTCSHMDGEGGGEGGPGNQQVDPEQLQDIVEDALQSTLDRALRGDKAAEQALLDLYDQDPDNPMWGTIGVGRLRGETTATRKTSFWEQILARTLESLLEPGAKYAYDRKIGWWYRPLTLSGQEPRRKVAIFIDTSGSMPDWVVQKVASLVGRIEGADAEWFAFDAELYPFNPGDPLPGGGGTSFQLAEDKVNELDEPPDAVVMLTDGYAPEIAPKRPQNYIWVITKGGSTWPRDKGMSTVEIDVEDVA